jgi:hypothetical protein
MLAAFSSITLHLDQRKYFPRALDFLGINEKKYTFLLETNSDPNR